MPLLLQRRANCSNEPTSTLEDVMSIYTVSSRELNQDVGRAKRAAEDGPVVITDRGRPSHVLLSWAEYRRLSGGPRNLAAVLAAPALSDIPFEPEKSGLKARKVDFN
jgi:prevent-host-death family protein